MSNAAKTAIPGGSDGSKVPVYNSGSDAFDLTLPALVAPSVVTSSGTGATTFDCSTGSVFDRTMTGNTSITLSNPVTGVPYTVFLRQNATGGFTVTWTTTVKWMGQDPIWSGVASKISGTATLMFVASAWVGWWGGGEQ